MQNDSDVLVEHVAYTDQPCNNAMFTLTYILIMLVVSIVWAALILYEVVKIIMEMIRKPSKAYAKPAEPAEPGKGPDTHNKNVMVDYTDQEKKNREQSTPKYQLNRIRYMIISYIFLELIWHILLKAAIKWNRNTAAAKNEAPE